MRRPGLLRAVLLTCVLSSAFISPAQPATAAIDYTATVNSMNPTTYLKLDEASGTVAADASGNGRNGTFAGTIGFGRPSVLPGTAINFGATNGPYALTPAVPISNVFTQVVWFKTTPGDGGYLTAFRNDPANERDRIILITASGQVQFYIFPTTTRVINSPKSYDDGLWHMAAASLSPSGMKLYVDGALVVSNPAYTTAQAFPSGTMQWALGAGSSVSADRLNGDVDEAAMWGSRALSDAEIKTLYNVGYGALYGDATVAVRIDPTMSFTVAPRVTQCGLQAAPTSTFKYATPASASSIDLGRLTAASVNQGAHDLSVGTNASSGATVLARGAFASDNLRSGSQRPFADSTAAPVAGTSTFGYTVSNTHLGLNTTWKALSDTDAEVAYSAAGDIAPSCIGFSVAASAATPALQYGATVIYTAVPRY